MIRIVVYILHGASREVGIAYHVGTSNIAWRFETLAVFDKCSLKAVS